MYEILILVLIGLDQLTKWLIRANLSSAGSISVIGGFFNLTYIENRGAAFGLLQNMKVFFCTGSPYSSYSGFGIYT